MNAIAMKMLLGDRAKYLGLVFGIAFAAMLMAQQGSIFVNLLLRTANQIIDVHEADIWVMDSRTLYFDEVEPLTDVQLARVRGIAGVAWAAPLLKQLTNLRTADGVLQQVIMLGVDDATLAGAPPRMLLGSHEDLRRPDALVMDRAGFVYIWPNDPPDLGREVEMGDRRAVIVGICEAGAPFTTFPVVYTRYSNALGYGPQTRNRLSFVLVRVAEGEDGAAVAERIRAETGLLAVSWSDFAWMTIRYFLERTGIPVNFGITVALGFIVGAAVAGQTFYIFVLENLRQFGALKAIGVANATILRMVLLQAVTVAAIGYAIGIGLAALFFETTSRVSINLRGFYMPWQIMLIVAVAVLAIIVVASIASVRRVMTVDPAIVFRG